MSTTTAGILFLVSLIVALVAVHVPLGDYMYRVYTSNKDSRGERVIYRLIGADPKAEQTWGAYARSVLAFSAISILFLFVFQLVQGKLPLHLNDPATQMTPALAWNTAVSFVTNTNWQAYSGESTQGHLVQMAGPRRAELRARQPSAWPSRSPWFGGLPAATPASSATSGWTWSAAPFESCCRSR